MNRNFKKTVSFILSVFTAFSCIGLSAFAVDLPKVEATVKEYIVAPGQYTNATNFGKNIEGTLSGKSCTTSLGNFGGYVVYEFKNNILNSNSHRYGIDFMIYGNAFNGGKTTQEPGQVYVSQNGTKWYALAGSEHYENDTLWDYSVTYNNTGEKISTYTDSQGDSGAVSKTTLSPYPDKDFYTTVTVPDDKITLSGILLAKQRTPSTANGILTSFGYVDALKTKLSNEPSNPYIENPVANGTDGQFDISWAVDEKGLPVKLDYIKYVKVQTATFIDGGAFGEKSTEINAVVLPVEGKYEQDKSEISIKVNNSEVKFDGNNYCKLDDLTKGAEIKVSAENSNVYINNERTTERTFSVSPKHGLVRIIVQKGDSEPRIFTLDISSAKEEKELSLSQSSATLDQFDTLQLTANLFVTWKSSDESILSVSDDGKVFALDDGKAKITASAPSGQTKDCEITVNKIKNRNSVTVSFCASDKDIIVPKQNITVKSLTAKSFGYDVPKSDEVTVFDVITAIHSLIYGDKFNVKTAENYLTISYGFVSKMFGRDDASGFLVNGVCPNDGIINPAFGTPTCYSCVEANVKDNDDIKVYFYQDLTTFADKFCLFEKDNYTVTENEKFTLKLFGYDIFKHGTETFDTIKNNYLEALDGVQIFIFTENGFEKIATTDKNGCAKIKFTEVGNYTLFAKREAGKTPVITAFTNIEVKESKNIFLKIIKWFKMIFTKIKDFFLGITK